MIQPIFHFGWNLDTFSLARHINPNFNIRLFLPVFYRSIPPIAHRALFFYTKGVYLFLHTVYPNQVKIAYNL